MVEDSEVSVSPVIDDNAKGADDIQHVTSMC